MTDTKIFKPPYFQIFTRESEWYANSGPSPFFVKVKDMNNGHLANVLRLNLSRLEQGMPVSDIITTLLKEAHDRGLSDRFLTQYHGHDPYKPYKKYNPRSISSIYRKLIKKILELI